MKKIFKERLPKGVVEKLVKNVGGGSHKKKKGKGSYGRKNKHDREDKKLSSFLLPNLVGDKSEGDSVHAPTLPQRKRTVIEYMPEVRVGIFRKYFGACHSKLCVFY